MFALGLATHHHTPLGSTGLPCHHMSQHPPPGLAVYEFAVAEICTNQGRFAVYSLAGRSVVCDAQAVASMLMGIQPDHMLEETHLQGRNPDIAHKRVLTWPYPPVLLLKAAEDQETYRERIDDSVKFFRRQVSLITCLQESNKPCCQSWTSLFILWTPNSLLHNTCTRGHSSYGEDGGSD